MQIGQKWAKMDVMVLASEKYYIYNPVHFSVTHYSVHKINFHNLVTYVPILKPSSVKHSNCYKLTYVGKCKKVIS